MRPDAFSGWGIRTLSSKERRYNPMGYHLGTVWPHDNSLVPDGFENRLRVVNPHLPDFIQHLEIQHLRVGQGAADLRFERKQDGTWDVQILKVAGTLSVEIENK